MMSVTQPHNSDTKSDNSIRTITKSAKNIPKIRIEKIIMSTVLYSLHSPPLRGMMTASLDSKSCLKVLHQILRIGQVACRFPRRIIARVAFPQDQVLNLSPMSPLVQNILNFILRFRGRGDNRRG
jgi:hypothetical protein